MGIKVRPKMARMQWFKLICDLPHAINHSIYLMKNFTVPGCNNTPFHKQHLRITVPILKKSR